MPYPVAAVRSKNFGSAPAINTLLIDLQAYWKLDETSGNRADSAGANTLVDNGGLGYDTGMVSNGVSNTGSNKWLQVADNASFQVGDADFTLAFWIYPKGNSTFISKGNAFWTPDDGGFIVRRFETFDFTVGNGTTSNSVSFTGSILNAWHFVVCGYDAANDRIFMSVDCATEQTAALAGGMGSSNTPFVVGKSLALGEPANGMLDEIGFWKRKLTNAEIDILYNFGLGTTYPLTKWTGHTPLWTGLYDYIPLNEASGNRSSSHLGKTFSLVNAPTAATGLVYANATHFTRASRQRLICTDLTYGNFGNEDVTIALAVYPDSGGNQAGDPGDDLYQTYISRGVGTDPHYNIFGSNGNPAQPVSNMHVTPNDDLLHNEAASAIAGQWLILRTWLDAAADLHYIQSARGTVYSAENTWGMGPGLETANHAFTIGGIASSDYLAMDGRIGPIIIWDRVLTAGEWIWLYNRGAFRTYAEL
jgi:hypothetical protein